MANNFVYIDAIPAQQYVSLAQISAAQDAERKRQQSETLRSMVASQVARDNAAAERARNDAYLNQREREAARSDVTLNKDLDLRRTEEQNRRSEYDRRVGKGDADKSAEVRRRSQFDTLAQLGSDPNDPPTPKEWAAHKEKFGPDLTKEELAQLTNNWQLLRNARLADAAIIKRIADSGNAALSGIDPKINKSGYEKAIADYMKLHGDRVQFDPRVGFMPIRPAPREDPPDPAPAQPGAVPGPPGIGVRKIEPIETAIPGIGGAGNPGAMMTGWIGRLFGRGNQGPQPTPTFTPQPSNPYEWPPRSIAPKPVQSFVPPMGQMGAANPYDYPPRSFAPTWQPEIPYPEGFWKDGNVPPPTPPPSQIVPLTPFLPNMGPMPVPFINPRDLMAQPTPPPSASINNPNNMLMALASLFGQGMGAPQSQFIPPPFLPVT